MHADEFLNEDKIHIMVDIETTGVEAGSGIWQIGAVVMDECLHTQPHTFLMTVNPVLVLAADSKYTSSVDTLLWQLQKNSDNWAFALEQSPVEGSSWGFTPTKSMLVNLCDWLMGFNYAEIELYSRGSFDFQLLRAAFAIEGLTCPWKYYQENDQRTLSKWTSYNRETASPSHNALDDAIQQAKVIMHLLETLKQYKANAV